MFKSFLSHTREHATAWIVAVTVAFCTLVATVLTFLNGEIWLNYVASYSIGMTCMSLQLWVHERRPESWNREWVTVITGIVSLALGLLLGGALGAFDPFFFYRSNPIGLVIGGIACVVAAFVILLMGYIRDLETERDAVRQQELVMERELATAQLRTLQAQIEPHFLFNTLANVQALIERDPSTASELVDSLTNLFRVSLDYSRSSNGTIKKEIELISSYLAVQEVRMGERLTFKIDVEDDLNDFELPPFLIQPLIENAIKHGLEPSAKPGSLEVQIAHIESAIQIVVTNTWEPDHVNVDGDGVGIENVKERLNSLYSNAAKLQISHPTKDLFRVTIELPLEKVAV
ncbi:MAG: histidine kinase [Gammaproteobacteria bacterium]|nr:histidine kinase [Gammaproteobacteria bacterium]